MELAQIVSIVTFVVTLILGFVSKKSKYIENNLIPVQNLLIGVIVSIVEWIITKDFNTAILLSGVLAGGVYDIPNNLRKLSDKKDEIIEEGE